MRHPKNHSTASAVLILAAGLGKRMKSSLPKVLHDVCGEPMLVALLRSIREAAPDASIGIIVGHGRDEVEAAVRGSDVSHGLKINFLLQAEQKGTGHAVRSAMVTEWGRERRNESSPILVLPGDSPLIPASLIEAMLRPYEPKE